MKTLNQISNSTTGLEWQVEFKKNSEEDEKRKVVNHLQNLILTHFVKEQEKYELTNFFTVSITSKIRDNSAVIVAIVGIGVASTNSTTSPITPPPPPRFELLPKISPAIAGIKEMQLI
ncbi:MAG TPA: hypothetical protein VG847_05060 [Chitinophagaceae bacterium]|nr:hypothetical protein [Chitinophagaceae bacterium]